jgi:hypothetical protein
MLTDKGETLRSMFPPMEAAAMNEFTECLTAEELKCLESLLEKVVGTEFTRNACRSGLRYPELVMKGAAQ